MYAKNSCFLPQKSGKILTQFPLVGFLLAARRWMMPCFCVWLVVLDCMVCAILLRII